MKAVNISKVKENKSVQDEWYFIGLLEMRNAKNIDGLKAELEYIMEYEKSIRLIKIWLKRETK
jgi:hypothetical protein